MCVAILFFKPGAQVKVFRCVLLRCFYFASAVATVLPVLLQLLRMAKPIKRPEVNKEIFLISFACFDDDVWAFLVGWMMARVSAVEVFIECQSTTVAVES